MIVIDTSALMAIVLGEPAAADCRTAIAREADLVIAAPTLTEALVVATGRKVHGEMAALLDALKPMIAALSEERAYEAFATYSDWGKGFHRAKLNYGDCFAYALAKEHDCPLLYVGNDFALTDIRSAIA